MRNSGITDCCQSQHSDFLTLFNTIRIMKEAPVVIIVMNTNGQSPYEDIDADGRVMEICDSLSIGASIQNMLLNTDREFKYRGG